MSVVATVTLAHGRHRHLERQQRSLAASTEVPALAVVVAMEDPGVRGVVAAGPLSARSRVVDLPAVTEGGEGGEGCEGLLLPLARARNLGVRTAFDGGADLVVCLDVDCMVGPRALAAYRDAASRVGSPALLCGTVAYLDPPRDGAEWTDAEIAAAQPHPDRPSPPDGEVHPADDVRLFWSLSFALDAQTWERIGGFDEVYVGYGGEDTDFGQRAAAGGVPMHWVGGALAHHQWHPVSDPPVEHVGDIVRNANLFSDRWGWWPMEAWLEAFGRRGLVTRDDRGHWQLTPRRSGTGPTPGGLASAPAPR